MSARLMPCHLAGSRSNRRVEFSPAAQGGSAHSRANQRRRQAYVVLPLVEESEKLDLRSAVDEHSRLQHEVFPDLQVGLCMAG